MSIFVGSGMQFLQSPTMEHVRFSKMDYAVYISIAPAAVANIPGITSADNSITTADVRGSSTILTKDLLWIPFSHGKIFSRGRV